MVNTRELPDTVEALVARERVLSASLDALKIKLDAAATKKEIHRLLEPYRPDYEELQAIKSKIKDLEQETTEVDHHASSSTKEKHEADSVVADATKADPVDTTDEPAASAITPEPEFTDVPADSNKAEKDSNDQDGNDHITEFLPRPAHRRSTHIRTREDDHGSR